MSYVIAWVDGRGGDDTSVLRDGGFIGKSNSQNLESDNILGRGVMLEIAAYVARIDSK